MTIKRGILVPACPKCFAVGMHEEDCDLPFDPQYKAERVCSRCGLSESEAKGVDCIAYEGGPPMEYPNHLLVEKAA